MGTSARMSSAERRQEEQRGTWNKWPEDLSLPMPPPITCLGQKGPEVNSSQQRRRDHLLCESFRSTFGSVPEKNSFLGPQSLPPYVGSGDGGGSVSPKSTALIGRLDSSCLVATRKTSSSSTLGAPPTPGWGERKMAPESTVASCVVAQPGVSLAGRGWGVGLPPPPPPPAVVFDTTTSTGTGVVGTRDPL